MITVALGVLLLTVVVPPSVAFAGHPCGDSEEFTNAGYNHDCGQGGGGDIAGFLAKVQGIVSSVVPFIIGLAVFVVIWGILTYITQASNEEKREEAKKYILWGVVGVFMMLSVWGFVNILLNTFQLDNQIDGGKIPKVPELDGGTG